jgi:hypothetical protein
MYVLRARTLANFFSVTIAAPANVTYVAPTRPSPTSSFGSTSDLVLTTPASTPSGANVTVASSSSLSGGAIGGISIAGVAGAVLVCLGVILFYRRRNAPDRAFPASRWWLEASTKKNLFWEHRCEICSIYYSATTGQFPVRWWPWFWDPTGLVTIIGPVLKVPSLPFIFRSPWIHCLIQKWVKAWGDINVLLFIPISHILKL